MRNESSDSGVVSLDGSMVCPSRQRFTEENNAHLPWEYSLRMAWARNAVVVLPLVPVMPTTVSSCCGKP